MPRKTRRNSSRKPRSSRGRQSFLGPEWLRFTDFAGGILGPGDRATWLRSNLAVPTDRDFWMVGVELQVVSEPSSSKQGATGGATVLLSAENPVGKDVSANFWNSGPIVIGVTPFRRYFRFKGSIPFSKDSAKSQSLILLDNICQRADDISSVRYVMRLDLKISPEPFGRNCPTILPTVSTLEGSFTELQI